MHSFRKRVEGEIHEFETFCRATYRVIIVCTYW